MNPMGCYRNFNLEQFKFYREESKNTLLYTLLLPNIDKITGNEDTWVEKALNQTFCSCHRRFFRDNYDFFGYYKVEDFSFSSLIYKNHYDSNDLSEDFFASTILSQCVMSSYDTVMQLILSDFEKLTPYAMSNKIEYNSYNSLRKLNIISDDFIKIFRIEENSDALSRASLCRNKLIAHLDCLKYTKFQNYFPTDVSDLSLLQSDILYRINDFHTTSYKEIIKFYTNEAKTLTPVSKVQQWNQLSSFYNKLMYTLPEDPVDYLYYLYRTEKIFNLNLASCLVQNVNFLQNIGMYPNYKDMNVLSIISKMPNVFSRTVYLQFAFEAIENQANFNKSFFDRIDDIGTFMSKRDSKEFNFHEWSLYFKKYCKFFSNLIFPVFEWYFFLSLLETAEENSKDTRSALLLLQKVLYDFIKNKRTSLWGKYGFCDSLLPDKSKKMIFFPYYSERDDMNKIKNPLVNFQKYYGDDTFNITVVLHNFYEISDDEIHPLPVLNRKTWLQEGVEDINMFKIINQYIHLITT